jgi:hypothetical protein
LLYKYKTTWSGPGLINLAIFDIIKPPNEIEIDAVTKEECK